MAQSYFQSSAFGSVTSSRESPSLSPLGDKHQVRVEDVQEAYLKQKDRLVNAIDSTKGLLAELQDFNKEAWVVRYPQLRSQSQDDVKSKRMVARRCLSFVDDPNFEADVVIKPSKKGMRRSMTLASIPDAEDAENADQETPATEDGSQLDRLLASSNASDFQVLRLDLKIGPNGSSTSPTALVSQLEKASIANLLDERIDSAVKHINKLRARVEDTSSKVLVTGDLNAGKSTFVNALLRREVMPVDQQPFTSAFCEVHDAAENGDQEEVHILHDDIPYNINDETTFDRRSVADLEEIVGDNEDVQPRLKIYLADSRAPAESLLNNGVVDISLIDAPGLNRDSMKTTAVFARQEEIDVVVFVVSAENHFTLSAKEFLWNASNEKAYLFIVVNKFESIKNKEKCRRLVLEQIKQLSPRTFEDADDLVHFVDSAAALQPFQANPAFDDLESSLRSFVLVKRAKSKLQPAATYLTNILSDIDILAGSNAIVAEKEKVQAQSDLDRSLPILQKMKDGHDSLESGLETVEEDGAKTTSTRTKKILNDALESVNQGLPAGGIKLPSYPGILGVWDYAREVRRVLLQSLDIAVKLAEDEARVATTSGVSQIAQLGDEHLPASVPRSRRVFMPEAMFSVRNNKRVSRSSKSIVVAGGVHGLGLGLAQRPEFLDTTISDIFDFHHHIWVHFGGDAAGMHGSSDDDESKMSALSIISVGLGTLTMVGGSGFGARSLIEGIIRLSDLFGNESSRKWAAPVVGAVAIGATAYFILELPSSIPRTVGRRIRSSLVANKDGAAGEEELFVNAHAARVSHETRKVLRLASWDLRERFRTAMEESKKEVQGAEETLKKAQDALEFFRGVESRAEEVREVAGLADGSL